MTSAADNSTTNVDQWRIGQLHKAKKMLAKHEYFWGPMPAPWSATADHTLGRLRRERCCRLYSVRVWSMIILGVEPFEAYKIVADRLRAEYSDEYVSTESVRVWDLGGEVRDE